MSTPASSNPFGPTVDVRFVYGPLLVGVFVNLILFGVLITQQLEYSHYARKDPLWMRCFVWGVFIMEVANAALDMHIVFQPLILNYGGGIPNDLPTLLVTEPLSVVLVAFPIQLFFLWRIRTLTSSTLLPAIICLFAVVAFAGGIWTTVGVPIVRSFRNVPRLYDAVEVWLIATTVTDISIAVSLAIVLRSKKTGFAPSDTVVDKIIRMTVQTGMLTAFFSLMDVVCLLALRGDTFNFMFNIPITRLYSNCFMSTLNARHQLNREIHRPLLSSSGRHADAVLAGNNGAQLGGNNKNLESTDDTVINDKGDQYGGNRMTEVAETV
ncbi:hypothetical protein MSAN_02004500 [Mycena sanguinolenta]|uniref:DUF6534 domain-containing protein n=1 Tax=Mycena sanguinolenta TaxID=230812 RepID=A0A8H7CNV2_9AGAR|nr:hypothetical protein MSAN_02004500 [Mycena sanguinolenta]